MKFKFYFTSKDTLQIFPTLVWQYPQPFNTVTWYDLLLRGEQINEFAPMTETELRLKH